MEQHGLYGESESTLKLRKETFLKYAEGWERPTPEEIRELIRYIGMSGSEVAAAVGIKSGRTVRKWQETHEVTETGNENKNKNEISYAAWRILLLKARLVIEP